MNKEEMSSKDGQYICLRFVIFVMENIVKKERDIYNIFTRIS